MAEVAGITINLTEALKKASEMDEHLNKWIEQAEILEEKMHMAFSLSGNKKNKSEFQNYIDEIKKTVEEMGQINFSPTVDVTEMDKMRGIINDIIENTHYLSKSTGVKLFDLNNLYTTDKSVVNIKYDLDEVRTHMEDLEKQINSTIQKMEGLDKRTKEYKNLKKKKNDLEESYKVSIEREKILEKELQFSKMTQAEKVQYVLESMKKLEQEEKAYIENIRKEYSKLLNDLSVIEKDKSKYDKAITEGNIDSTSVNLNIEELLRQEEDKNKRRKEIESDYWDYVIDIAEKKVLQMSNYEITQAIKTAKEKKKEEDRQFEEYKRTPEGALGWAESAKSIEDMRESMGLLKAAYESVDRTQENSGEIIKKLKNKYIDFRISIEEAEKSLKNEQTLQPTVRNEYLRTLREIDKLKNAYKELTSSQSYKVNDSQALSDEKSILARLNDLNEKKIDIEKAAQGKLDAVYREYEAGRTKIHIDEIKKREQEDKAYIEKYGAISARKAGEILSSQEVNNVRTAQQAIENLKAAKEKLSKNDTEYKETLGRINAEISKQERYIIRITKAEERRKKARELLEKRNLESYSGAMEYSKQAKTVDQLTKSIKYLDAARKKENITTEEGRKRYEDLTSEMNKNSRTMNDLNGKIQKSHSSLMDLSGQLMRKLALVFSVSAIQGYINKLMTVRGEFELQQRSLQSILRNKDEANRIWNQTIDLAIHSPFRISQLVGYTKQLAAYRIESSKLYETNKMLADISAGLGVEMDRLILAYGQVKASTYLRATEVRQFTEAGIPLLEELSKYFSEIENKSVSIGDVFERISKRLVTFSDVEEIFKRMTDAGGVFYNMQEIQANTLKGQISNLKDSLDVMLNDIGKSNQGIFNFGIKSIKFFIDNWKSLIPVLKAAVGLFTISRLRVLSMKSSVIDLAKSLKVVTLEEQKQLTIMQLLKVGWKSVTKYMKEMTAFIAKNPYVAAIMAAAAAVYELGSAIYENNKAVQEIQDRYNELKKSIASITINFDTGNYEDKRKELQQLESFAKNNLNISLNIDYSNLTPENIVSEFEAAREKIISISDFSNVFSVQMQKASEWRFLQNDIFRDFEQLKNSYNNLSTIVKSASIGVANSLYDMRMSGGEFSEELESIYIKLTDARNATEDEVTYINRLSEALRDFIKYSKSGGAITTKMVRNLKEMGYDLPKFSRLLAITQTNINEAEREYKRFLKTLNVPSMLSDEERTIWLQTAIDKEASEQNWSDFELHYIYEWTNKEYNVSVGFKPTSNPVKELTEWQKKYKDLFSEKGGYYTQITGETTQEKIISHLNDEYSKTKDLIDKINKAGTEGAYSGESLDEQKKKLAEIIEQLKWFGVDAKKDKEAVDTLNKKISLLKEIRNEYQKLTQTYDKATAKEKIVASYADAFDEAFKGTGINLTKIVSQIKPDVENAGEEIGSTLTDEVKTKIEELAKSGTYIRNYTDDFVEQIKKREGFRAKAYWDKAGKKWTQGYGETKGITEKSPEMTKEQAEFRLRNRLTNDFAKEMNDILDKHKELVFTQEQYNQLLDVAYQGSSSKISDLIKQASDVEVGVEHIQRIYDKVKEYVGEDAAQRFGDSFIQKFREAETIYDRMALLLQTTNLLVTRIDEKTGKRYTAIDKDWYAGMQTRSDTRSAMFSGDLDIASAIEQTLIRISSMDFTSVEGMVDALEQLRPLAEKQGQEAVATLERAISGFKAEINLEVAQESNKKLKNQIEDMFDRYELTLEFDKLTLPKEIADKFIGGGMLDLDELKESVIKTFSEAGGESSEELSTELNKGLGEIDWLKVKDLTGGEVMKEIKDALEKIDGLENKAAKERMKTYSKYLMEEMNDRVKLRIETLKKIKEIEESEEFNPQQKERITSAIKEESRKEEQKMDWEDFKGSDMYTMMFEDIEYLGTKSIEVLKNKLEELKSSLSDLPESDVKEIINQIEKLEDVAIERNPFKSLASYMMEIRKLRSEGKTEDVLQTQFVTSESNIENYQEELDAVNSILSAKERGLIIDGQIADTSDEIVSWNEKYNMYLTLGTNELTSRASTLNNQIKNERIASNEAKKGLNTYKSARKALKATADEWGNIKSLASQAYDGIKTIVEVMGGDADSIAMTLADSTMSLLDLVAQAVMFELQLQAVTIQAEAMGVAMNAAMGPIGWIVIAIQAIATLMKAIFSAKDKALQNQIEEQQGRIEKLVKEYEKLEKEIKKALSIEDLKKKNDEMITNIENRISAINKQIEAEQDKKNPDQKVIDEYNDSISELQDKIIELGDNFKESLGGFGSIENMKSASEEFLDSWIEAFQEAGDGLSGLNEQFDEFFMNLVKKQVLWRGLNKYLEGFYTQVDALIEEGASGSTYDMRRNIDKIRQLWAETAPDLNNYISGLLDALGVTSDIANQGSYELSTLQKGIEGITEPTAEVIAAYLNSLRFFVSEIHSIDSQIVDNFLNSYEINPYYREMKNQTNVLNDIKSLLESIRTPSTTQVGYAIKVEGL